MPRPCKRRRICAMPGCDRFGPMGGGGGNRQAVHMTLDEFETIRLIDLEELTQEECAQRMNVARTTAQSIYNSARHKLAECLISGKELLIKGGEYVLCDGNEEGYHCKYCCKRRCHNQPNAETDKSRAAKKTQTKENMI